MNAGLISIVTCCLLIGGQWLSLLLLRDASLSKAAAWTLILLLAVACNFWRVTWAKLLFIIIGIVVAAPLLFVAFAIIVLEADIKGIPSSSWILLIFNALCGVALVVNACLSKTTHKAKEVSHVML